MADGLHRPRFGSIPPDPERGDNRRERGDQEQHDRPASAGVDPGVPQRFGDPEFGEPSPMPTDAACSNGARSVGER